MVPCFGLWKLVPLSMKDGVIFLYLRLYLLGCQQTACGSFLISSSSLSPREERQCPLALDCWPVASGLPSLAFYWPGWGIQVQGHVLAQNRNIPKGQSMMLFINLGYLKFIRTAWSCLWLSRWNRANGFLLGLFWKKSDVIGHVYYNFAYKWTKSFSVNMQSNIIPSEGNSQNDRSQFWEWAWINGRQVSNIKVSHLF